MLKPLSLTRCTPRPNSRDPCLHLATSLARGRRLLPRFADCVRVATGSSDRWVLWQALLAQSIADRRCWSCGYSHSHLSTEGATWDVGGP